MLNILLVQYEKEMYFMNFENFEYDDIVLFAKSLDPDLYTSETYGYVKNAIKQADAGQMIQAYSNLKISIDGLQPIIPEKLKLYCIVKKAKSLNQVDYTANSRVDFIIALNAAVALLGNVYYTENDLTNACRTLLKAINGLIIEL